MAKLAISGLITKNSVNKFTLKPTAEEFTLFILAFGLLKYTACAVSIASGFAFFYYKLSDLIGGFANADVIAAALAVVMLVCLELITNTATAKAFKMLFKQHYRAAVGCIIIAVCFFSVSFKISCQGIYLAISDTHNETQNINDKYNDDINDLKKSDAAKIAAYESDIAALVGPEWNHYALTTYQLQLRQTYRANIDSIYKAQRQQIAAIQEAQAAELAATNAAASSSAEDYRGYVAIILILEILANGILQYYNKKILHDTDKAVEKQEFIDQYVDETRQELGDAIKGELAKERNLYMSVISAKAEQARQADKDAATVGADPRVRPAATAAQPKRAAGFDIQPTAEPDTAAAPTTDQPAPPVSSIASAFHADTDPKTAQCKYCGATFTRRTTWQKYCCEAHRIQAAANAKGHAVRGVAPEIISNA